MSTNAQTKTVEVEEKVKFDWRQAGKDAAAGAGKAVLAGVSLGITLVVAGHTRSVLGGPSLTT